MMGLWWKEGMRKILPCFNSGVLWGDEHEKGAGTLKILTSSMSEA